MNPALQIPAETPVLVHDVSWPRAEPQLVLSFGPLGHVDRTSLPLLGRRLAFIVDPSGRFCTGVFVAPVGGVARHEPCDGARLATTGAQCERCSARDESRFMHHVHRGGYVPESLAAHLARPHWLYVATFADGTSKIGTANDSRKRIRLDEQGAVRATYVARTADGLQVRVLEDAVTERAGIPQTKHKSAKAAALTRALPPATLDARHADAVDSALSAIDGYDVERPLEPWSPPATHADFFADTSVHPTYPHPLDAGQHRLTPRALVGSVALVSVNDEPDVVLVDLDRLRGRRITFTDDARSPSSATQHSLF